MFSSPVASSSSTPWPPSSALASPYSSAAASPAPHSSTSSAPPATAPASSAAQGSSSSSIVVLHPGSRFLRLGLASDAAPKTVAHCIARRRKRPPEQNEEKAEGLGGVARERGDPLIVPKASLSAPGRRRLDACLNTVRASLSKGAVRSDGSRRFSVPVQHLRDLNGRVKPRKVEATSPEPSKLKICPDREDCFVGDDALELESNDFELRFPFARGDLNLHEGIGGSRISALSSLVTVWGHSITSELGICKEDLANFRAVLVIPALFRRPLVKHLVSLLLNDLGFKGCFVLQDHVAATFGAGLPYACVVDIGDQKTSISCVDDGTVYSESRIHMDYGSADITQVFHHLLEDINFAYAPCLPCERGRDFRLVEGLKRDCCHLVLDRCGVEQRTLKVSPDDGRSTLEYDVSFADEAIMAPLALFHPDMLAVTGGAKAVRFATKDQSGDPEDPHDQNYLSETSRKYTRAAAVESSDQGPAALGEDDLDIVSDSKQSSFSNSPAGARQAKASSKSDSTELLPLDAAIARSVDGCPTEDVRRKMFFCILLVGCGAAIEGLPDYLRSKLALHVPSQYRQDPMDVVSNAKETDGAVTSWRGAAIMASMETAQELWITPEEWRKHGQRILRERAPFAWS